MFRAFIYKIIKCRHLTLKSEAYFFYIKTNISMQIFNRKDGMYVKKIVR